MDKTKVKSILAPYSPPLSATQIEEISNIIAEVSNAEIVKAVKKAKAKKTRRSKSLRDREYSGRTEETA